MSNSGSKLILRYLLLLALFCVSSCADGKYVSYSEENDADLELLDFAEAIESIPRNKILNRVPEKNSSERDERGNVVEANSCTTPQNQPGICVTIFSCPNYKSLILQRKKPKICLWADQVPIICCPIASEASTHTRPTIKRNFLTLKEPMSARFPATIKPPSSEGNEFNPNRTPRPQPISRPFRGEPKTHQQLKNCGTHRINVKDVSRVVGGEVAYTNEFPWDVAIFHRDAGGNLLHECGGSIISDRHILTAAHCFDNVNFPSSYLVGVGHNELHKTVKHEVESIFRHPDYDNSQFYNDIAVLRLKECLEFDEAVRPICLPDPKHRIPPNDLVTISGWGFTEYNGQRSRTLLKADLNVLSRRDCNKTYSTLVSKRIRNGITLQFLCAGTPDGEKDACQSDSGGALVHKIPIDLHEDIRSHWEGKFVQVGIVSFGYKCGVKGFPGVYTDTINYLNWINEKIDEESLEPNFILKTKSGDTG